MKRFFSLLLSIILLASLPLSLSFASSVDFSFVDSMPIEDVIMLRDYCQDIISAAQSVPLSDDSEPIEATRTSPALVGDRILVEFGDAELAITIEYLLRGDSAKLYAKSFNRYNTASYRMSKGTEWVLCYLKIESLSSDEDRIDLSDYYFHMISDAGIDLGNSYISDNPLPVNAMYAGSTQYCWYGMCVPVGTKALLTFEGGYGGSTYWFDLSRRRLVDTSAVSYSELGKGMTGDAVNALQLMLCEYGFMSKLPSGSMDSTTSSALKKFQKAFDLKQSGVADEESQRVLFSGAPLPQ